MSLVMMIGSIVLVVGIVGLTFVAAAALGLGVYRGFRASLYNRPLTAQEQWAETSREAEMDEEEWSALLAWANDANPESEKE